MSDSVDSNIAAGEKAVTDNATAQISSSSATEKTWGKDGSVNDYTRFEKVDDPDAEGPLVESLRCKDRGNSSFKEKNFAEAITHYTEVCCILFQRIVQET